MKFYGQFNPPVDQVLYDRYFNTIKNGVSIECGAFDGITENCTKFFEDNLGWTTINIEPLSNVYKTLTSNRPNSINLNIALSDREHTAIIRNYKHPLLGYDWGNASISHTDTHKKELEILCGNTYIEQDIKTITYKTLIKYLNITQLDLFVLDVEGHEDNVIRGMYDCDVLPAVFVIEHGHKNVENFKELLEPLKCKYKLDYVSHVNSFYVKTSNLDANSSNSVNT